MFLSLIGFLLQPIPGDLVVIAQPTFYEISGSSAEDLRAAMNRLGPTDKNGARHDGLTDWTARWDFLYRPLSGVCYLTSFTTTLTVNTTLPKWETGGADASLQKRWDAYLTALELHESGHAEIGQRAARAIQEKAAALASARSCPALVAAIKSSSEALLIRHRKEDAEYDRRTGHGASQGARFP